MVNLGDKFPNFKADTSEGELDFYDWVGDSWCVLFSHPADFTPVCTSELGRAAELQPEFEKRNVKIIGLSCDDAESHRQWIKDIEEYCPNIKSGDFKFPIIADPKRDLAVKFGMLDPELKNAAGLPLTCRAVFIIGPDKKLKLSLLYPSNTGRNFDEILRAIDSLQLTAAKKVATPADWKKGDAVVIPPNIDDDKAKELFPEGFKTHQVPSGKNYLRTTKAY